MGDTLQQINIKHVATEDRLLVRLRTSGEGETTLYLTRRFVGRLWPALVKTLGKDPAVAAQADPVARSAVMAFRHEHAVSRGDFSRPYKEPAKPAPAAGEPGEEADPSGPETPGAEPELVVTCQIQTPAPDRVVLSFKTVGKRAVAVNLSLDMLHGFCRLLQQGVGTADWGLVLALPSAPATPRAPAAGRVVN